MKKKKIIIICLAFVCWILFSVTIMYAMQMKRVEQTFVDVKKKMLESTMLKEKFGGIKKVKFNNFLQWTVEKNGRECVNVVIVTNDNLKYDVCTIVDDSNLNEPPVAIGYIIDDEEYFE